MIDRLLSSRDFCCCQLSRFSELGLVAFHHESQFTYALTYASVDTRSTKSGMEQSLCLNLLRFLGILPKFRIGIVGLLLCKSREADLQ